jgi:predicted neuraminidase
VALLGSTGEVHSFATVLVDGRRVSQDGGKTFAAAETMIVDAGTFIRQPIVTMANGDLLLPVFKCRIAPGEKWSGHNDNAGSIAPATAAKPGASLRCRDHSDSCT